MNRITNKPLGFALGAQVNGIDLHEPLGSAPTETVAFIHAEQDKWSRVIRDVGIKAE